jgi:hypothetical protein
MKVDQPFLEENQQVITIFISTIAAKIINLSYFCSLYLILLTSGSYLLRDISLWHYLLHYICLRRLIHTNYNFNDASK